MAINVFNYKIKKPRFTLYPLYDLHIGSNLCDIQKMLTVLNVIKKDKDAYFLIGGDALDMSIKDSIGDVYTGMNPAEEGKKFLEIFKDMWDKCFTVIRGNHEMRLLRSTGIDLLEFVAPMDLYAGDAALVYIIWGNKLQNQTSILVTHGNGSATTPGGQMNSAIKMDKVITNVDFVLSGHTHQLIYFPDIIYVYNNNTMQIDEHITQHIVCGSYLKWGDYATRKSLKPSVIGSPRLIFDEQNSNKYEVQLLW
mgnify:FL=1